MFIRVTPHRGDYLLGHDVFIDDCLIGVRPYDGTTDIDDIRGEVRQALVRMLRGALGWQVPEPEQRDPEVAASVL